MYPPRRRNPHSSSRPVIIAVISVFCISISWTLQLLSRSGFNNVTHYSSFSTQQQQSSQSPLIGNMAQHIANEPKGCWRQCPDHVKNKNIILLDHYGSAGLNDRGWIFKQAVELAGYLCATVRVPPPRTMLSSSHNGGSFLPPESKWGDFMVIRFIRDDTPALLEYDTDEFNEDNALSPYHLDRYFTDEEFSDWLRLSFSSEDEHGKEVITYIEQLEEFTRKQIDDPSFSKGFILESKQDFNWFDNVPFLIEHFEKRQVELGGANITSPFPFVCEYTYNVPSIADDIAVMVFDTLEETFPETDHFGMFHIRRGDAIGQCDTSLSKIRDYLTCSLDKVEMYGKISILFTSDERNACYRSAIQDMVKMLGVRFIDLDSFIEATVSKYAASIQNGQRLLNNMFIYKVEKVMEWNERLTFRIAQRREISCAWCDQLHSNWQFNDKPILASPYEFKKSVDYAKVMHSHHICEEKLLANRSLF